MIGHTFNSKIPPQSLEAEYSVLGGLMLEREAFDQISDLIDAQDFYKPAHQLIYKTIRELHQKANPVDIITGKSMHPAMFFELTQTLLEKVNSQYYLFSDAVETVKALRGVG